MKNKKIVPFIPRGNDEEEGDKGVIRRIRRLFRSAPKADVSVLVPKDVRDKFKQMPTFNGEVITKIRDFFSYIHVKKRDETDELHDYYSKIEARWLTPDEFHLFKSLHTEDFNLNELLHKLVAYENSAVNVLRIAIANNDEILKSKANTRYHFAKLMMCLLEERLRFTN